MPEPDGRRARRRQVWPVACATSSATRSCSARWRSTCSRSSSAAPSRCCRSSPATSSMSARRARPAAHGAVGGRPALDAGHHAHPAEAARGTRSSSSASRSSVSRCSSSACPRASPLSLAALFVAGLADGVSVVIRIVIVRVESPEAMRGPHRRGQPRLHRRLERAWRLRERRGSHAARGRARASSLGGFVTLAVVGAVAVLAPAAAAPRPGPSDDRGPGRTAAAWPTATATATAMGSNLAAADVDPGLEPLLDVAARSE